MNMTVLVKKCTYGLLLIATTIIGLCCNFSSASNFEGFQTIYSQNFNSSNYSSISTSNSNNLLTKSSLGIYCSEIKVNSIDNFSSSDYNQLLTSRFQRDYDSNYRNDDTILSMYTFSNIADFNYSFINCTSLNQNNGYIFIKFYSSNATKLQQLFETYNLNLSFNVYYYTGYDLLSSSCASSSCDYSDYVPISEYNSCQSNYLNCQSILSGYENTLNNCSNNLNSCNSTLSQCLQANCPATNTGEIQWSSLFINNIQHIGAGIIDITIPEEIEREYYNGNDEIDIEITGYGYDQERMQNIVNTQFTPPTSEDLSNAIGKIADFLPLLAIMLLIVYAWWLIKKVF